MRDDELERFKAEINLLEFAATDGYLKDERESSKKSFTMRHPNGDKIVITEKGGSWVYFSLRDPSDNGKILNFVLNRAAQGNLGTARQILRRYLGSQPPAPLRSYTPPPTPTPKDRASLTRRFVRLHPCTRHTALIARGITPELLTLPRFAGCVFIDDRKNACFPHFDRQGVAGWEMKNAKFTGFSAGGGKALWFSKTKPTDKRLVITESAIDALSHAALFPDENARYFSTGGSLNNDQPALIRAALEKMPEGSSLIIATDNDEAGHALAEKIKALAPAGMDVQRPHPTTGKDWNDQLKAQARPPPCKKPSFPTVPTCL